MLATIRRFFEDRLNGPEASRNDHAAALPLATAALMIEIMRVESAADPQAFARVTTALEETFDLEHSEIEELIALAEQELATATDLYQFTRLINEHWGQPERIGLIRNMWRVAWADGSVNHYEEHLIRRIADLIHVRHGDFIQAKQLARQQQSP